MNRDRLHRRLTLGANLGVLSGLLLLVVELRQNATMMRAQTRNDDDVEFSRQREAWRQYATRSDALVRYWCAEKTGFSEMFVAEFDELLSAGACPS